MMKKLLSLLCGMVMIGSALADLYIPTADFNGYDTNGFPIHGNFGEQGLMRNVGAIEGIDIHDDGTLDPGAYPAYRPETGVEAFSKNYLPSKEKEWDGQIIGDLVVVGYWYNNVGGEGEWLNYTRDIPRGIYFIDVHVASGGLSIYGDIKLVTSDWTQPDQTTTILGEFSAPPTDGWGDFITLPVQDGSGKPVLASLNGLTTLRLSIRRGANFDAMWIRLRRVGLESVLPPSGSDYSRAPLVEAVLKDYGDILVDRTSLILTVDGTNVTSFSTVTTNTEENIKISWQMGASPTGTVHVASIVWKNQDGATNSETWVWTEGIYNEISNLFIQAEDMDNSLDPNGIKYYPSNPLTGKAINEGGLYEGLSAKPNTDYRTDGNPDYDYYRVGDIPNLAIIEIESHLSGLSEGKINYKVGYLKPGDWTRYTRTFPEGFYNLYGRLSSGAEDNMRAHLDLVSTNRVQTLTRLGEFNGPPTGDWQVPRFVPLAQNGKLARIFLKGEQRLQLTMDWYQDPDCLMLVPVLVEPPRLEIIRGTNYVTISWTDGILQTATKVTGPWSNMAGTSPLKIPKNGNEKYFRAVLQ